jgi:hypothetical protein
MDFSDMNLWGIIAMPVGLILCFAPAMIVWWLTDGRRREPSRSTTQTRR